jgi:hypothetical protein
MRRKPQAADVTGSPGYLAAQQFRDELLSGTTERGRKTVENVWTVCEEMALAGEEVFVAEVGRRLKSRFGGPNAQSIRDQPERLKRLVDLVAEATQSSKPAPGRREDDLLADIKDQTIRAQVRLALEERDRLRKEVTALKKAFERIAPIRDLSAEQCYRPMPDGAPEEASPSAKDAFAADERAAVRRFLSPGFLHDEGFRIDDRLGLLSDETGRSILPPAFVRALRKISGPG